MQGVLSQCVTQNALLLCALLQALTNRDSRKPNAVDNTRCKRADSGNSTASSGNSSIVHDEKDKTLDLACPDGLRATKTVCGLSCRTAGSL